MALTAPMVRGRGTIKSVKALTMAGPDGHPRDSEAYPVLVRSLCLRCLQGCQEQEAGDGQVNCAQAHDPPHNLNHTFNATKSMPVALSAFREYSMSSLVMTPAHV